MSFPSSRGGPGSPGPPTPRGPRAAAILFVVVSFFLLGAATAQAAPPTITKTAFSHVTTTSVRLEAEVNPQKKVTLYHFEYGPADCAANPCTQLPDAQLEAGEAPVPVTADVGSLEPATTYHFRVVAKNFGKESGETPGPDVTLTTFAAQPPFGPCPNDAFRAASPSAALPDCRAYEQASPVDKNGIDITGEGAWARASEDGSRVSFLATNGLPGATSAQEIPPYLASRLGGAWSTQTMLPPASLGGRARVLGWSPDFSQVFDYASDFSNVPIEGALVERSSADGSITTIVPRGGGLTSEPSWIATSPDGSQVFFQTASALLAGAKAGKSNVYLWDAASGKLHLAAVLNDGETPAAGAFAGTYGWIQLEGTVAPSPAQYARDTHVIATDRSLFFTEAKSGRLFARHNPSAPQSEIAAGECTEAAKACTVEISASQRTPPDPLGSRPAAFMAATPDGSKAFFTSPEELTADAKTGPIQPPPAIQSAPVAGSPIGASLPIVAGGIAKDSEHLYWATPRDNAIGRADLNGANANPAFIEIPKLKVKNAKGEDVEVDANPQYVAVDSGHVYWTSEGEGRREEGLGLIKAEGKVGRADINGTPASVEGEWIGGLVRPHGIAVDGEYVYWANHGAGASKEGKIGRAKLDGSQVPERTFIQFDFQQAPEGLALDATHIYSMAVDGAGSGSYIQRNDIADGADEGFSFISGGREVHGVAVDAGHLYWASQSDEAIGRLPLSEIGKGPCETLPSCERHFIPLAGSPIGLINDGTTLRWSVNGETPPHPGNDLYRYDAEAGSLEDVAPDPGDPNGAEVLGVLGASDDGSYVYFAANGDLDGAGPATAGNCGGGIDGSGVALFLGACSLYLAHDGAIQFLAPLDAGGGDQSDAFNWLPRGGLYTLTEKSSQVTPDGLTVIFRSQRRLTSYDNKGTPMLYRYRVGESAPTCISCNPTGRPPSGLVTRGPATKATFPEIAPASLQPRVLSPDGNRAFFVSTDALVPADTNGEEGCSPNRGGAGPYNYPACQDVYEWEAQGAGPCGEDVQGGGCLYLLSGGTSERASFLIDGSTSGADAFLLTDSPLVGQDQDQLYDVYDASIGGGLAAQSQPPPPVPCEGEACRAGAGAPPSSADPGTPAFTGPPSPPATRCPKGRARRGGKCRPKQAKNHHRKRPHHRAAKSGRSYR